MKIVFFGSSEFAAEILKAILSAGFKVAAVVTVGDKKAGRHLKDRPTPVKEEALSNNIMLKQPGNLLENGFLDWIRGISPDVFVVAAYGKILPGKLLDLPVKGAFNVHASLLPKYRGAAPVQYAILNGEEETGITVIKMTLDLDAGDMLLKESIPILPDETASQLQERLGFLARKLIILSLRKIEKGQIELKKQDKTKVTYAPKITKKDAMIDWSAPALKVFNQVRALQPWPGAFTCFNKKLVKVLKAEVISKAADVKAGRIVDIGRLGIDVSCWQSVLRFKQVQPESSKAMSADDFARGARLRVGDVFESKAEFKK